MAISLSICPKGAYTIAKINNFENRLLEMGFIPGESILVISNDVSGIKVRIRAANYLLNQVTASEIYVK